MSTLRTKQRAVRYFNKKFGVILNLLNKAKKNKKRNLRAKQREVKYFK